MFNTTPVFDLSFLNRFKIQQINAPLPPLRLMSDVSFWYLEDSIILTYTPNKFIQAWAFLYQAHYFLNDSEIRVNETVLKARLVDSFEEIKTNRLSLNTIKIRFTVGGSKNYKFLKGCIFFETSENANTYYYDLVNNCVNTLVDPVSITDSSFFNIDNFLIKTKTKEPAFIYSPLVTYAASEVFLNMPDSRSIENIIFNFDVVNSKINIVFEYKYFLTIAEIISSFFIEPERMLLKSITLNNLQFNSFWTDYEVIFTFTSLLRKLEAKNNLELDYEDPQSVVFLKHLLIYKVDQELEKNFFLRQELDKFN